MKVHVPYSWGIRQESGDEATSHVHVVLLIFSFDSVEDPNSQYNIKFLNEDMWQVISLIMYSFLINTD